MTLPGTQTRLRSLRTRSTIITFSARFFAERSRAARCAAAWSRSAWSRGAVPLMGLDSTPLPARRRNSSGERLATAPPGTVRNAAYGGARAAADWQNASSGSPRKLASARRQMLAWKMSPCPMYSTAARTAARCSAGDGTSRKSPHWKSPGSGDGSAARRDRSSNRCSSGLGHQCTAPRRTTPPSPGPCAAHGRTSRTTTRAAAARRPAAAPRPRRCTPGSRSTRRRTPGPRRHPEPAAPAAPRRGRRPAARSRCCVPAGAGTRRCCSRRPTRRTAPQDAGPPGPGAAPARA